MRAGDLALLAAAAFFKPLSVMAINLVGIVHPERLIAIALVLWALGVLLALILIRARIPRSTAVVVAFLVIVFSMTGGPAIAALPGVIGYVLLIGGFIGTAWLLWRMDGVPIVTGICWGLAAALLTGPALGLYDSWTAWGESSVGRTDVADLSLPDRPDIFVTVLDGYPGFVSMGQEGIPVDDDVVDQLTTLGFELPMSAWAPYWTTSFVLPSVLDMGYPLTANPQGSATWSDLFHIISGDNRFREIVASNGYTTHLIESGWTGSSCGQSVDECVVSSFVDEAVYLTLKKSMLAPIFSDYAGPFVEGALASMSTLERIGPELSKTPEPDFVFAHLMAPHPPYFLESDCSVVVTGERAGTSFKHADVGLDERREYLAGQISCVNQFITRFATQIEEDDVVIFFGDHGTDRREQGNPEVVRWSDEAIIERMNVFVAARLGKGCSVGDRIVIANLLRSVLDCYAESPIELIPPRMWINPTVELDPYLVQELLAMSPAN